MEHLDARIGSLSRRLLVVFGTWFCLSASAVTLDVSESPRSNLILALRAILSAPHSIVMNAYELTSYEIADALIQKIKEGVRVEILQEGQPVGGLSSEGEDIQKKITQAMKDNSDSQIHGFWVMSSKTQIGKRRFRYNHAKYIVTDEKAVLVGSENYSPSGQPEPGSPAGTGTRGWQTFIYDAQMAQNFLRLFRKDANTSHGDLITLYRPTKNGLPKLLGRVSDWVGGMRNAGNLLQNRFSWMLSDEPKTLTADTVEFLTSPESSLVGLLAFIDSAQETLDVQLMSFNPMWGKTGERSPLLSALIAAAKRGVKVRLLINDSTAFGASEEDDKKMMAMIEGAVQESKVTLSAAIADLAEMRVKYVHNKGALADGYKTLISSINWNQNSVENNRETAISVDSREINSHYQEIFNFDWQASR